MAHSQLPTWLRSVCVWGGVGLAASCGIAERPARAQEAPTSFQAYPLKNGQADDLAPRLRQLLQQFPGEAKVIADAQGNQILVQGPANSQQLAAQLLRTLDQPQTTVKPEPVASEVKGYRVDGDMAAITAWLQNRFSATTSARIAADERTKQIIVIGPPTVHRDITALLAEGAVLETPPAPRSLQTVAPAAVAPAPATVPAPARSIPVANNLVHRLQHITWRDLEAELVRLWGDQLEVATARDGEVVNVSIADSSGARPVLQIDRRASEVSFTGTQRTIATWRTAVAAIDSPRNGDRITQLVPVRNADPSLVQSTMSLINPTGSNGDTQVTQAVAPGPRKRNASDLVAMLYQQAAQNPPANPNAADRQAPAPPAAPDAANPNAPADPNAPAEDPADDTDLGLIGPVQIEIINDAIIIRGNRRDVARVRKLIEDIDRYALETQPSIEVYQLEHINSEAATTLVGELYTEILAERTGQVSIRSLGEPNAILLIGREESVAVVKELIQKIDQPSPPSSRFEVFRLKNVSAVDAEQTVRNFFVNRPGFDTTPRSSLGARIQIIGDYRTNSLIVQASPRDMEEVRRLIETLDVEESQSAAVLRVFKLKNSLAETMATTLQSAITGESATGQTGQGQGQQGQGQQGGSTTQTQSRLPAVSLELMMIDQAEGRPLRSGILSGVQVTADTNTNSLIVRAPAKSLPLIEALIAQLDRLPDMASQVKVFEIINGNATSLTTMLQQLFGQTASTTQTNQNALGGLFGGQNQLQTSSAGGESSLVPLRFAVDQRTNSIIASGSEADLDVVETILLRLDEDIDDRRLTVVRLRNTQAASVAQAVQQYLTNLQQQVSQQLLQNQSISAFESVERQVFVIAESVTNSLIVSASPRYQEEILRVIAELDVRPPMVMVQVLIAELDLDNTFEFGAEFGLQDSLVFDRGKAAGTPPGSDAPASPGFNFNNNPLPGYPNVRSYGQENVAGQSLTNFALGRSSGALGYSGLVLSAASESISILLRALQDEGRLQILSRPQIMTMHNQAAYVQVGQDVARITGGNVNTLGGFQPTLEDRSIGLILRVLPLINDDGVIVLGLEAERSEQGSELDGTPISTDPTTGTVIRVPPINLTKATTTVSARDGQTVVFAGLITKRNDLRLRRVPYLADVPVLGKLFEFESNFERRTELLIVMTPHIVRDDADIERIKLEESSRMSWCLADVVNVGGDWGLQGGNCAFCENEAPLIFPDVHPAGMPVPAVPHVHSHSSTAPAAPAGEPGAPQTLPVSHDHSAGALQPADEEGLRSAGAPTQVPQLRPTNVLYGPAPGVTPANYERAGAATRLPSPN